MKRSWLVGYDINSSKIRRVFLKHLRAHSSGYQDSVFEVTLSTSSFESIINELVILMQHDTDRFLFIPLTQFSQTWQLGAGAISPTNEIILIN
jgi:CRISPR-associated endonuclease Cas2